MKNLRTVVRHSALLALTTTLVAMGAASASALSTTAIEGSDGSTAVSSGSLDLCGDAVSSGSLDICDDAVSAGSLVAPVPGDMMGG